MAKDHEATLVARALEGDSSAFEDLVAPHLPVLYAYCRALCADHYLAEDMVQETALIAYRNLSRFFPEADFSGWLKAIARRQTLANGRKQRRLRPVADAALEFAYADVDSDRSTELRQALAACVRELSGRTAEVVRRHYFEGHPLNEIAEALGANPNTVKTWLHRARRALRTCAERRVAAEDLQ